MKTLNVYASLDPNLFSVGFPRDDLRNVIHTIAQAAPGEPIIPSNGHGAPHWPCAVCEAHGYSPTLFNAQIEDALMRGPNDHR